MILKALIFDFDGTILDTERTEILAWQFVYQEYGFELPLLKWIEKNVGTCHRLFDPFIHLSELVTDVLDENLIHQKRRKKLFELIAELQPFPGVLEWITAAKKHGMQLGIASNSDATWVHGHLERLQLKHYFDVILTREDVMQPKPHPEIYERALAQFNIQTHEALVIEDSPAGVTAALAAKIECVVVPNSITEQLIFPKTKYKLKNLLQISLEQLLSR